MADSVSVVPAGGAQTRGPVLRAAVLILTALFWISALLFGLYILARYVGAIGDGLLESWNRDLPRLYEPGWGGATASIGLHFITGVILLVLGPLQFVSAIRTKAPGVHRWVGRIYVTAAFLTGLGGLAFIATKGTVGGLPMDVGFSLYGVLVVAASVLAAFYAWRGRFDVHRAWAIRLFALVIGSWLFRMGYGFWLPLTQHAGHTPGFDGSFDIAMAFMFYIPNLVIAEIIIRNKGRHLPLMLQILTAVALMLAIVFVALGTYYFTRFHWGADILNRLAGTRL